MNYKDKPVIKIYLPHNLRMFLSKGEAFAVRYTNDKSTLEIEGPVERYELFEEEVKHGK